MSLDHDVMHVYDANQNHTHYDYDDNGRLKTVVYRDTTTESNGYRGEGHKTKFTDRASHVTQYVCDPVGLSVDNHLTLHLPRVENSARYVAVL